LAPACRSTTRLETRTDEAKHLGQEIAAGIRDTSVSHGRHSLPAVNIADTWRVALVSSKALRSARDARLDRGNRGRLAKALALL